MSDAFDKHLRSLARLGKKERAALRESLTTEAARDRFVSLVSEILQRDEYASADFLEDFFNFGAEIAATWPDDQIYLDLDPAKVDRRTAAFVFGFRGLPFSGVFSADAVGKVKSLKVDDAASDASSPEHKGKTPRQAKKPRHRRETMKLAVAA